LLKLSPSTSNLAESEGLPQGRIQLLPNPVSGASFQLLLPKQPVFGSAKGSAWRIVSLTGTTVLQGFATGPMATISVQGLAPGVYVVLTEGYSPARLLVQPH
jgi:hypothetical protein